MRDGTELGLPPKGGSRTRPEILFFIGESALFTCRSKKPYGEIVKLVEHSQIPDEQALRTYVRRHRWLTVYITSFHRTFYISIIDNHRHLKHTHLPSNNPQQQHHASRRRIRQQQQTPPIRQPHRNRPQQSPRHKPRTSPFLTPPPPSTSLTVLYDAGLRHKPLRQSSRSPRDNGRKQSCQRCG